MAKYISKRETIMIPDERFKQRFDEIRDYLLQVSANNHDSMIYYKRRWDECRGDKYSDWGCCDYYFEAAPDGTVTRQMEIYDSGTVLQYHAHKIEDTFGGLTDQALDPSEGFVSFTISREEFETAWTSHPPTN
jgi:hypothetical protein